MTVAEGAVIEIVQVERLSEYNLRLHFSDGATRVIDFEPFLSNSRNPLIRAYLDPKKFGDFRLEHGDLVWNDFGLCFPIADLYEGTL
ncbi:MAG TPA: DUF2442 domain-containing protein [Blastocatellia bacterium]|nr:DUF2442 domain-containing protein [Blastocatellia bacterium]